MIDPLSSRLVLSYDDKLSKLRLTDELVALLCEKEIISRMTKDKIKDCGNLLVGEPLRAVCVTIAEDHAKLQVLIDILLKFEGTESLGRDIAHDCKCLMYY